MLPNTADFPFGGWPVRFVRLFSPTMETMIMIPYGIGMGPSRLNVARLDDRSLLSAMLAATPGITAIDDHVAPMTQEAAVLARRHDPNGGSQQWTLLARPGR